MLQNKYQYIRIAARILGGVVSAFYLFIAFKGGLVDVMKGEGGGRVPFFPFLALAAAGYMITYVHEKKGGYFMLGGGVSLFVFFLVNSGGRDWISAIVYGIPFILPGIAFVYCAGKEQG